MIRVLLFLLGASLSLSAQRSFNSPLPILLIDTLESGIPNEPKVTARLRVIDNGPGATNRSTNPANGYNGLIGIELRGSSSLNFPKKGYGFETRNEDGSDRKVSLMGFPEEEDWVLHGPYSDKTLIRNALAYHLAGEIMAYAPRIRMTEVILDGNYHGVYLFTERIKRDKNRVDVAKLNPDEVAGDDLTGGYIIKIDKLTGEDLSAPYPTYFTSRFYPATDASDAQRIRFVYHYPKPEDMVAEQRTYIEDYVDGFETALFGANFSDPETGYQAFVDLPSFIDFFLLTELSRDVDGYRISTFFHKAKDSDGGKLRMGPVWDFNLAFANANYCDGSNIDGWAYNSSRRCQSTSNHVPAWWDRLLEDPTFNTEMRKRWQELRQGQWSDEELVATVDSLCGSMGPAVDRNFDRWPVLGTWIWPNNVVEDTHEEECDYLKTWLQARAEFMDDELSISVSTRQPEAGATARLYPNPTTGDVFFDTDPANPVVSVGVMDAIGRVTQAGSSLVDGRYFRLGGRAAGVYFLQARFRNGATGVYRVVLR